MTITGGNITVISIGKNYNFEQKMENEKINNSINHLITNSFLNQSINCKLYVCHYMFCSYVLTKRLPVFEFALDLLEETLAVAYLNKKRKISEFYDAVNYCISISISLGIELEIDELIDEVHNNQRPMKVLKIHDEDLLNSNSGLMEQPLYQKNLPLFVLLQIRKNKINKKNHMNHIQALYDRYSLNNTKEYLVCISLISYFFKKKKILDNTLNQLAQLRLRNVNKQIINLIRAQKRDSFPAINTDITTVIMNIDDNLNIDLSVIYYFLIHEKVRR